MLGVHSQAPAGVGIEESTGCRIQPDREFGESGADSASRCVAAHGGAGLGDPDAGEGTGTDEKGNVSKAHSPLPFLLLQTCHYQRKDSPVEALTLSPEPLGCDRGKKKGETGRQRKAGRNKGNV